MARDRAAPSPGGAESGRGAAFFDRVVATLALLVLAFAGLALFLLALGIVSPARLSGGWEAAEQVLGLATQLEGWRRVALLAGSVVVSLGSLALLLGRSSGDGRVWSSGHHIVDSDELGFVLVETAGVAAIVERAVLASAGVVDCVADIRGTGSSPVRVILHVGVQPGVAVPRASGQAREAARTAIERLAGLEVRDVHVKARVVDADELARRVT